VYAIWGMCCQCKIDKLQEDLKPNTDKWFCSIVNEDRLSKMELKLIPKGHYDRLSSKFLMVTALLLHS
jgi:hypothetical protein